jgi:hypothetical protein
MGVNFWAVLVCAIISMVVGAVWYGPLFGKKWVEIIGATEMDMEKRKEMQKGARKLYAVSFLLSLFQIYILALFVNAFFNTPGYQTALWIWAAFVVPTVAAGSMWNNDSSKISWTRFLIQAGYYLLLFIVFGVILSLWR